MFKEKSNIKVKMKISSFLFLQGDSTDGVWAPSLFGYASFLLFLPNLRSKIFQNFFIFSALWTLNFLEGGVWVPIFFLDGISLGTNFYWSC